MSIEAIQHAIRSLPPTEVRRLAAWMAEYHAEQWDEQIAADVAAGRLAGVIKECEEAIARGQSKPL